jgi:pimeloyl-ACP methyl ester carboxylesterase
VRIFILVLIILCNTNIMAQDILSIDSTHKKKVYLFSGLGVDERVFRNLIFEGYDTTFIKWISPEKNEAIEVYAKRISQQIKTEKPILIGLSFGGIMAIEVSKIIECEKIILISSAKTKYEIPWYYRLAGKTKIQRILPEKIFTQSNAMLNWFFGVNTPEEKLLLKTILNESDPEFNRWGIDKIVSWKNKIIPKNLTHIHGTSDRILPSRYVKKDFTIEKGGHFMVLNKAEEINVILKQILNE